ncbi:8015_t:CDS:2 [Funneliformis caledonium]|uniref:8015_t:CDS:1 n=1 Tax=Funneliformis caledonium TaxID=1117310 RepID=A0A9N9C7Q1_9GLOM|nr:8015_t:CDS:2 [Funneliformis caledonium]
MFCNAAPFIEPTNNNNDEEEYVFRDVLGSKFEEQYALQNNFAVFKHKTENFQMVLIEKGYLSVIWEEVQFSEIPVSDDGSFESFFDKVEDSAKSLIKADEDQKLDLKSLILIVSFNDILEVGRFFNTIT